MVPVVTCPKAAQEKVNTVSKDATIPDSLLNI
jgi:hypothetical protein